MQKGGTAEGGARRGTTFEYDIPEMKGKGKLKAIINERVNTRKANARKSRMRSLGVHLAATSGHDCQESSYAWSMYIDKTGVLPYKDVLRCLFELGIGGNTGQERWLVERMCMNIYASIMEEVAQEKVVARNLCDRQWSIFHRPGRELVNCKEPQADTVQVFKGSSGGGVGFQLPHGMTYDDFVAEVVPAVRGLLKDCRHDLHFELFIKFCDRGHVLLPVETFRQMSARCGVVEEVFEEVLMASIHEEPGTFAGGVDFETCHEMLVLMEEKTQRAMRAKEMQVRDSLGMPESAFWHFRHELLLVKASFDRCDTLGTGLAADEVRETLKSFGMQPYSKHHGAIINELLVALTESTASDELGLMQFLALLENVRHHERHRVRDELHILFTNYAKCEGTVCDLKDLPSMLGEAGLVATTTGIQMAIHEEVEQYDTQTSGVVTFREFEDLFQRVTERLGRLKAAQVQEAAKSKGITGQKLAAFNWAFDQVDTDGSGGLDMEEIKCALTLQMVREPRDDELRQLYKNAGIDPSGETDIVGFMTLMQAAAKVGLVPSDPPFTIRDVQSEKLRDILRLFQLAGDYVSAIQVDELVELVANFLGVAPNCNLAKADGDRPAISTQRQLLDYARSRRLGV